MIGGARVGGPVGGPNWSTHNWDDKVGQWRPKPPAVAENPPSMDVLRHGGGNPGGGTVTPVTPAADPRHDKYIADRDARLKARADQQYQDKLRAENNAREDAKRKEILDRIDREMAGGNKTATPGAGAPAGAAPALGATEQDARAAAFSRAKDQAGRIARSSLTQIAEQVASRGMSGASVQALQEAGAIGSAENTLQDLGRDQMISDVNRAGNVADRDYAGQLAMRGQDMQNRQSYLSLLRGLY